MENKQIHDTIGHFLRLDRKHRMLIERQVGEMGLHRSGHRMLMHLSHSEQMPSQAELAKRLEISPPAVANTLKRLEQEGYIRRDCSKEDGRNMCVRITEKGREILENTRTRFNRVDKAMLEGISEQEIEIFSDLLTRMYTNLNEFEKRCEEK